jgi:hypothetical protein
MAKLCRDCRRHALIPDPASDSYSIDYCPAHGIVIDPSRLSVPACSKARFDADAPAAPARAKGRANASKRPRSSRS